MPFRLHRHLLFCSLGILFLLASCTPFIESDTHRIPSERERNLADNIFRVINDYRAQHGLNRLKRHKGLDSIALGHTQYLISHEGTSYIYGKNVTHIGYNWRVIAVSERYHMNRYGENIAAIETKTDDFPDHLLLMWKTSFYHNRTMLGPWTHTGISVLIDKNGLVFVTQVFAAK